MSKFLILSEAADGCGLALRLKREGHEAKLWIRDSDSASSGHGIVDYASEYSFGQTVVADCTGSGVLLDKFHESGVPIFGGSTFADRLESDRELSDGIFRDAGIPVPDSERINDWDSAHKLIEKIGQSAGRVVLKPEGHLSGVLPSYVAYDLEDARKTLEHWKTTVGGENASLTIQEFIPGIAISTEGWFNGKEWLPGMFNHTIERKQVMNDDLGPSGGCSGNVVWKCDWTDPLVKNGLLKITPLLEKHRYIGAIDINAVVTDSGFYALEFTPRFGYDAFPTLLLGLCDFDFGAFLEDCARGYESDVSLREGFSAGVRISIPPWPDEKKATGKHVPVDGFKEADWLNFYPYDVQMNEDKELETAGGYGIVGVFNGTGETIGEAFARAYVLCERMRIPNKQYRTDLAEVCLRDYRGIFHPFESDGWYGVDLDKTLAKHRKGQKTIGDVIPKMLSRVRRMATQGKEVRILTARAAIPGERFQNIVDVHDWLKQQVGIPLEVTSQKDHEMVELYDDRVVEVEANTGELA